MPRRATTTRTATMTFEFARLLSPSSYALHSPGFGVTLLDPLCAVATGALEWITPLLTHLGGTASPWVAIVPESAARRIGAQ